MSAAAVSGAPAATAATAVHAKARPGRVDRWRRCLLATLVTAGVVAVVAAAVVFAADQVTFNRYDAIVRHDSSSVDAAMDARADLLDNAAANAALLVSQSPPAQVQARATAEQAWTRFQNDLRRSWQNLTDPTGGERAAFQAADAAQTDYDRAVGAMTAALSATPARTDDARAAFLQANTVLEQRLLPALSTGLEDLKVEDMTSDYGTTSSTERAWLVAVVVASVVLLTVAVVGLWLTRRMHYRVTWEIVLALVIVAGIGAWVAVELRRADTQARVMVNDAYNTVAGVRDEIALISQQHERESIAILDPQSQEIHFAAFDNFTLLVERGLCGDHGCSAVQSFLAPGTNDSIVPAVVDAGLKAQDNFGLARPPLVSNVRFAREAAALDQARAAYRGFLTADQAVRVALKSNNPAAATAQSAGGGAQTYAATVAALDTAGQAARAVFDSSWQSVESASTIGRWLAAGELVAVVLIARGLWRRRSELFPSRSA